MNIFGAALTITVTFMQIYVFWRSASLPIVKRHIPSWLFIAAGVLLWIIFFTGRSYGHRGTDIFAKTLELCGMTWMAVVFLLFSLVFIADLLTGFGVIVPRANTFLRTAALAAGLILSAAGVYQGMRQPVVRQYEVTIPGLSLQHDGKTIVALTDLHIDSEFRQPWLNKVVSRVLSLEPDLIVLAGDIFEGHFGPDKKIQNEFSRLKAPLGVWGVLGNHEFYGGLHKKVSVLEPSGISFLRNQWTEVAPGLILAGTDDLSVAGSLDRKKKFLHKTLAGRPEGTTVLLSHTPDGIETACGKGVDLMLSGHTHGGQIWPFGYLVKIRFPFMAGLYKIENMNLIVSRGAGTWGARMRLWHPNEIVQIVLHSGKTDKNH